MLGWWVPTDLTPEASETYSQEFNWGVFAIGLSPRIWVNEEDTDESDLEEC